jgi:microcin C transport system permease protein
MIESWISNNSLAIKRYRKFKKNRLAVVSLFFLLLFSFFSFTAELWSNSKPIILKYNDKIYFPILFKYHPTEFGREDIFVMDYRALKEQAAWSVWPINKWDPFESNKEVALYPSAPTADNWFGTDESGRDVFARILYGFRYSMGYAFGVWIFSYLLGSVIGSLQGFFGGKWDLVGSRFVELLEMIPQTLLLITLISIFDPTIFLLITFTVLFDWTAISHQMRAQFFQLRKREYVEAARALGASNTRIVFRHVLPNALTPLITFSPFTIASSVYTLAILDYLGLGLRAPTPSWGELMGQAQKYFSQGEWLVWFPSGALLITMVALINIGLAIRDAYDARA